MASPSTNPGLHQIGTPAGPLRRLTFPARDVSSPGPAREILDRMAAAVLLVASAPVFLLAALLVRLTSPGPVLFRQERVGLGGRTFRMLKFRSMIAAAESMEDELASEAGDGPFYKVRHDPRVTRVGRLLRLTSLDELPQLINILKGDMSLVGPRPLLLREDDELPVSVRCWRHAVKPGLTGLWQVSGRSRTTDASRMRLDRLYVEQHSLGLDLFILLRTPSAVLRADGAV